MSERPVLYTYEHEQMERLIDAIETMPQKLQTALLEPLVEYLRQNPKEDNSE